MKGFRLAWKGKNGTPPGTVLRRVKIDRSPVLHPRSAIHKLGLAYLARFQGLDAAWTKLYRGLTSGTIAR